MHSIRFLIRFVLSAAGRLEENSCQDDSAHLVATSGTLPAQQQRPPADVTPQLQPQPTPEPSQASQAPHAIPVAEPQTAAPVMDLPEGLTEEEAAALSAFGFRRAGSRASPGAYSPAGSGADSPAGATARTDLAAISPAASAGNAAGRAAPAAASPAAGSPAGGAARAAPAAARPTGNPAELRTPQRGLALPAGSHTPGSHPVDASSHSASPAQSTPNRSSLDGSFVTPDAAAAPRRVRSSGSVIPKSSQRPEIIDRLRASASRLSAGGAAASVTGPAAGEESPPPDAASGILELPLAGSMVAFATGKAPPSPVRMPPAVPAGLRLLRLQEGESSRASSGSGSGGPDSPAGASPQGSAAVRHFEAILVPE